MSRPEPRRRGGAGAVELAVVAGATLAGAALRLWQLGASSLWADELIMWITSRRPFAEGLTQLQDYSAPLYQLLLRGVASGPHPPEWLLRGPSALFGVLCVPAAWAFGRALFGPLVGGTLAVLVALNPAMVDYARNARPNSLFVLLSLLSMTAFWRLRGAGGADPRRAAGWAGAWAASSLLLVYAHYLGTLVLAAQALYLVAERAARGRRFRLGRPTLVAGAALAVGLLPALWLASRYVSSGAPATVGWIPPAGLGGTVATAGQLLGWTPWVRSTGATALGAAFLVLAAAALVRPGSGAHAGSAAPSSDSSDTPSSSDSSDAPSASDSSDAPFSSGAGWERRAGAALCAAWILCGLLAFLAIEALYRPLLTPRYALPAAVPLLAAALAFARALHPGAVVGLAAVCLGVAGAALPRVMTPRPGLREAAAFVQRRAGPATPLYVIDWAYSPGFVNPERVGLAYYGVDLAPVRTLDLAYPHDVHLRNPDILPARGRALILGFVVPALHTQQELIRRGWRVRMRPFSLSVVLVAQAPGRAPPRSRKPPEPAADPLPARRPGPGGGPPPG